MKSSTLCHKSSALIAHIKMYNKLHRSRKNWKESILPYPHTCRLWHALQSPIQCCKRIFRKTDLRKLTFKKTVSKNQPFPFKSSTDHGLKVYWHLPLSSRSRCKVNISIMLHNTSPNRSRVGTSFGCLVSRIHIETHLWLIPRSKSHQVSTTTRI